MSGKELSLTTSQTKQYSLPYFINIRHIQCVEATYRLFKSEI